VRFLPLLEDVRFLPLLEDVRFLPLLGKGDRAKRGGWG